MDKNNKVKDFFRKEGFYLVLFICLCIVATVAAFTIKNNSTAKEQSQSNNEFTMNTEEATSDESFEFQKRNAERVENNDALVEENNTEENEVAENTNEVEEITDEVAEVNETEENGEIAEVESEDELDISDKISLENFRQVKVGEEKEVTIESDGDIKHNSSITIGGIQEEFDALSHIIKEINELFNLNFGETEVLAAMQVEEILKSSEDLQRRAKNKSNTIDKFKYSFNDEYQNAIIHGLERNQFFFETLLTNEKVNGIFMEFMADRVYSALTKMN